MSGTQSSEVGYQPTLEEAKLLSIVEGYEVLVSDLLAIIVYLLKGSDRASS